MLHLLGQEDPTNSLLGLGHAWLLRSQTSLARIQQEEGSSSSGMCGGDCRSDFTDDLDESTDAAYANEANNRRHTADYVEARATLQPATEYLARAVHIAERQGVLHGRLLSLVSVTILLD